MTKLEALKILIAHNAWRRGAEMPHCEPSKIGRAIDVAIKHLRKKKAKK